MQPRKPDSMKPKIYATAGSLEEIRKLVSRFYNGATITLDATNTPGVWSLNNTGGYVPGMEVARVDGRFLFRAVVEVLG